MKTAGLWKRLWRTGQPVLAVLFLSGLALTVSGCSRAFWRNQGELDAYDAISEKNSDYRWAVPRFGIVPDPRSRFYSPYDPDSSPLPPDDPAAHIYMHWVDGWEGYKSWHQMGQAFSVENPQWVAELGTDELAGSVVAGDPETGLPRIEKLTLKDAIQLSLIHSRNYQTQIENVYLAALDLTSQRFRYSVQYNSQPFANGNFTSVPDGVNSFGLTSGMGIAQFLPSGAQYLVELTNNTLWVFSNGHQTSTASNLSYQIVQPLFRDAGRKFVLNSLTQSERDLLYTIRELARFRKIFFVDTVVGGTGYLSLLSQVQSIKNQEFNLDLLRERIERQESLSTEFPGYISAELPVPPEQLQLPDELRFRFRYVRATGAEQPAQLEWFGWMDDADKQSLKSLAETQSPDFRLAVDELIRQMEVETRVTVPFDVTDLQIPEALAGQLRKVPGAPRELVWVGPLLNADVQRLETFAANDREAAANSGRLSIVPAIDQLKERLAPSVQPLAQVQLESQLPNQLNQLESARTRLQNDLDAFKIFMGLPPDVEIDLDLSLLQPFELISQTLLDNDKQLKEFAKDQVPKVDTETNNLSRLRAVVDDLSKLHREVENKSMASVRQDLAEVQQLLAANRGGVATVPAGMRAIDNPETLQALEISLERDERTLAKATEMIEKLRQELELLESLVSMESLEAILISLDEKVEGRPGDGDGKAELTELPELWDEVFRSRVERVGDDRVDQSEMKFALLNRVLKTWEELQRLNSGLVVLQAGMRSEKVPVNAFQIGDVPEMPSQAECVELAMENRLDLMNERARVMDSRRLIEVAANQLEAVLDVVVDGDIGTSQNRPLDFRGEQSVFRAGFRFTAPVTQVAERNTYNESIVNYWRRKRAYMLAEDTVKLDVRVGYRNLMLARKNIENDRQAIRLSAIQYDSAVEGSRSANDALNLLNALNNILRSQNALISDWLSYERNRLNIFLDMGIMEIDPRGLWYDPFYQALDPSNQPSTTPTENFLPPAVLAPTEMPSPFGSGESLQLVGAVEESARFAARQDGREPNAGHNSSGLPTQQTTSATTVVTGPALVDQPAADSRRFLADDLGHEGQHERQSDENRPDGRGRSGSGRGRGTAGGESEWYGAAGLRQEED